MQKYLSHELGLDLQGGCRRALTWQVVEELGQATNRESVSDTSIRLAKLGNISVCRSSASSTWTYKLQHGRTQGLHQVASHNHQAVSTTQSSERRYEGGSCFQCFQNWFTPQLVELVPALLIPQVAVDAALRSHSTWSHLCYQTY